MASLSESSGPPAEDPEHTQHDDQHDHDRHERHPRLEHFIDEAIEAEFETGRREESEEKARAHLLVRVARITAGSIIVILGVAALVLPGPGVLLIAVGLALLSVDVPFAQRLLDKIKHRLPQDHDGKLPKGMLIFSGLMVLGGLGGSIWWTFLRDKA